MDLLPTPSNLTDLPTDILCHITAFLEMWQLFEIPRICKRMHLVSLCPSSFNGEFIMPLILPKCRDILHRFCNCHTIHFKYKNSLRCTYLNYLIDSWSIEKRNNVRTLHIEKQFDHVHLDALKSCFPNIQIIVLNANGRNFRNNSSNEYYINSVIPLITLYFQSLTQLHIKFDILCDTIIVPNAFIKCIENLRKLEKFSFAGITMDLRNKNIDFLSANIFPTELSDRNTEDPIEIPICGVCLPININHNYITELKLNWDVCSNCMANNYNFNYFSLSNLEKLCLRLCLKGSNTSLIMLNKWINNTLCFENIYELKIDLVLTRDLWSNITEIVRQSISELIRKIINNNSYRNYKRFIFKICETDCGNATYLHLLKNILCKWIKVFSNQLKRRNQTNGTTYIVEIIIDHQLPELIFIDEYHYRPITLKSIQNMFENIMEIEKEINFRLILQKNTPWTASSMVSNGRKYEEFYDSLKHEKINILYHNHQSFTWIIFNYISYLIKNNNKQQLLFNTTSSTMLNEISVQTLFQRTGY